MSSNASRNIPELLSRAQRNLYEGMARTGTVPAAQVEQRTLQLKAAIIFAVQQPFAVHRLQNATTRVRAAASVPELLPHILNAALEITGASSGDLRLWDPHSNSLRLVTQFGLDAEIIDRSAVVSDGRTVCGQAALRRRQVVVEDLTNAELYDHWRAATAVSARSVQSTPLLDYSGRLLGVVSTLHVAAQPPTLLELRLVELLAVVAGEQLSLTLDEGYGIDSSDAFDSSATRAGAVARGVMTALLTPEWGESAAGSSSVAEPDDPPGDTLGSAFADELAQVAELVIAGLFRIGLSLDGAYSLVTDHVVRSRLTAASHDVDQLIQHLRAILVTRYPRPEQ
ncbi:MAG TPA: GAF domain-containing protein [Jatrophihabitans sp.]|nr:GAF domain-containing protein [Jatrophihabitans sp.]